MTSAYFSIYLILVQVRIMIVNKKKIKIAQSRETPNWPIDNGFNETQCAKQMVSLRPEYGRPANHAYEYILLRLIEIAFC